MPLISSHPSTPTTFRNSRLSNALQQGTTDELARFGHLVNVLGACVMTNAGMYKQRKRTIVARIPTLCTFSGRFCGNASDADDLIQENEGVGDGC